MSLRPLCGHLDPQEMKAMVPRILLASNETDMHVCNAACLNIF